MGAKWWGAGHEPALGRAADRAGHDPAAPGVHPGVHGRRQHRDHVDAGPRVTRGDELAMADLLAAQRITAQGCGESHKNWDVSGCTGQCFEVRNNSWQRHAKQLFKTDKTAYF